MTLRFPSRPALVVAGALATTLAAAPAMAATSAQHTSLTISTSSTGSSMTAQTITGKLLSNGKAIPKAQTIRLVARLNGSTTFKTLRFAATDPKTGTVTFSVKPPKGHDVYALVYNGSHKTSPAYDGSHSRTVTVTVSK